MIRFIIIFDDFRDLARQNELPAVLVKKRENEALKLSYLLQKSRRCATNGSASVVVFVKKDLKDFLSIE